MRADLVEEKHARVDVQVAQAVHHPFGLALAVLLDQPRHDRGVSGTDGGIGHVAE
ncbi:hypothetical protein D9M73_236940 [compost metagenome]